LVDIDVCSIHLSLLVCFEFEFTTIVVHYRLSGPITQVSNITTKACMIQMKCMKALKGGTL